jgi:protoporphyrin/coproporphyrin ferrochelatase
LVYQSRSGPPHQPWLEPDIQDCLRDLGSQGVQDAVVAPIGFTSDHLEVLYDLDTEARAAADAIGLSMYRAATVGTDPRFVSMIRELILERIALQRGGVPERRALGTRGPNHDVCPADCCPAPSSRPRPHPHLTRSGAE